MKDDQLAAQIEKENLWIRNYRDVVVAIDVDDDGKLGITEDDVRTKVELRLRQASIRPHLSSEDWTKIGGNGWVSVQVRTLGAAFSLDVIFMRDASWILPNSSPASHLSAVWSKGTVGVHGHDRAFVLSSVVDAMDHFLNAYLKANQ
jgi:hypothetical protein